VAIGYSQRDLARRLGVLPSNFAKTLHHNAEVRKATAVAVAALYEELAMTPVVATGHREKISASRARRYAAWMMWHPPLAWDDETIDDPYAEPVTAPDLEDLEHDDVDEAAVLRSINGDRNVELTPADRREVIRVLHARGLTDSQIAELAGFRSVTNERKRLGLEPNRAGIDWSEYGERPRVRQKDSA